MIQIWGWGGERQNLLTIIATAFITGNAMNYYTNEGSFHVSAKDCIAVQRKVQNFSKGKHKAMSDMLCLILEQYSICLNARGLLLLFITFTDRCFTISCCFKSMTILKFKLEHRIILCTQP